MIVSISGYGTSGKDTIADVLCEEGFERLAFADKLRECVQALNPIITYKYSAFNQIELLRYNDLLADLGYEQAKAQFPEFRGVLQRLGTDAGRRVIDDNIWVNATLNAMDPAKNYVLTDCRFPNEAQATIDAGGVVWRVERPGVGPANEHISEVALDDWDFDEYIVNDGTLADLADQVRDLLYPAVDPIA